MIVFLDIQTWWSQLHFAIVDQFASLEMEILSTWFYQSTYSSSIGKRNEIDRYYDNFR
jgi:hypothetical protein